MNWLLILSSIALISCNSGSSGGSGSAGNVSKPVAEVPKTDISAKEASRAFTQELKAELKPSLQLQQSEVDSLVQEDFLTSEEAALIKENL